MFQPIYKLRDWVKELCDVQLNLLPNSDKQMFWRRISANPCAGKFLEENYDNIYWPALSKNTSPEAGRLLKKNPHYIAWDMLSTNSSDDAMDILEQNQNNIY